ncbi:MAG: DUF1697 domain-containing protein [Bacteroidia bacterium]|nr:DUF1697 domain-containing protein [Bacteroidia bacterium]
MATEKELYIAIVRGINVGGKKVLMADFKVLLEGLKYSNINTYIQSGNVIFRSAKKLEATLEKEIFNAMARKFGFVSPVIVTTFDYMKNVAGHNPFLKEKDIDLTKLHVTFLADEPSKEALKTISELSFPPDKFIIKDKTVYLYCPVNYGETKLSNKFFESKLKVTATTRNWNTVNKLVEIGEGLK